MKIDKYNSEEVQNEKKLLEFFLLKLGEIKFQTGEINNYVNGRGITVVALAVEFNEFDELISKAEDKLIQIRKRFLGDNSISMKNG